MIDAAAAMMMPYMFRQQIEILWARELGDTPRKMPSMRAGLRRNFLAFL